jgi:hypothetical protein
MRYLYQKDVRALPGNLLNPIHGFFLSYSKCSVFHYFATSVVSAEAEESPLFEVVTRKGLVKTLQDGEDLVFAPVIFKV